MVPPLQEGDLSHPCSGEGTEAQEARPSGASLEGDAMFLLYGDVPSECQEPAETELSLAPWPVLGTSQGHSQILLLETGSSSGPQGLRGDSSRGGNLKTWDSTVLEMDQ